MPLIVERVTSSEMKQEAMNVRFRVFVDEQKFAAEIEIDEQDDLPTTVHFIGKDSETNEYVAVARCMVDKATRKGKIGRVAVLSKCRGKGFGFQIMQGIEAIMKGEVDSLSMHSQYDKKGFYEKCGYHCPTDEVFIEEGVEHCFMTKTIA
ncbi:TPA: hypothetical protein N0F65_002247 [Lagenidium giganteum]|uniref:N-acetyltransferase domain-containing protein n=1 Tax=Lagenidium giganteum TaxID=4803 RepID=A0AAV2YQN1_9STRA|nr:TPA: hypothetical protein N0F65_002247 [Lagenidium giganteum]